MGVILDTWHTNHFERPAYGETQRMWSPISSTLIYATGTPVLVDTFITVEKANFLVDWVKARGKNLTTIYITHGHGDHWFGIGALLDRFPDAREVATPAVALTLVVFSGRR